MKIICAWCKKAMEEKPPLDDDRISHSICQQCKEDVLKDIEHNSPCASPRCGICEGLPI